MRQRAVCGATTTSWIRTLCSVCRNALTAFLLEARVKRFILIAVILLVAAAAPVLPQTQSGQLATAIQEGRRAAALAMIKAGADVNQAQPDGTRPIHWAVYRVDHELVDALIANKARVDVANEFGHTPLAEAVRQGDARIVKTLLGAGSGTEGANADGQTALMVAIKKDRKSTRLNSSHSQISYAVFCL